LNLYIGRLRLSAPGLAEPDAERLGLLVANGLAAQIDPLTGGGRVDVIEANIAADSGTSGTELSGRIVAEILRQLNAAT
jgi:hypothetical protein